MRFYWSDWPPLSPDNRRLALWPCVAWSQCLCPTPNQPEVNKFIYFLDTHSLTHPAVAAAQDPAAAGADEAGRWHPEVLNVRIGLHDTPRPQVQHLTLLSSLSLLSHVWAHLERAGGVQGVHQQSPPPRVRGQATHRATVIPVNLRRSNREYMEHFISHFKVYIYRNCLCCERKQTSLKVNWFTPEIQFGLWAELNWILYLVWINLLSNSFASSHNTGNFCKN